VHYMLPGRHECAKPEGACCGQPRCCHIRPNHLWFSSCRSRPPFRSSRGSRTPRRHQHQSPAACEVRQVSVSSRARLRSASRCLVACIASLPACASIPAVGFHSEKSLTAHMETRPYLGPCECRSSEQHWEKAGESIAHPASQRWPQSAPIWL